MTKGVKTGREYYKDWEELIKEGKKACLCSVFEEMPDNTLRLAERYVTEEGQEDYSSHPVLERENGLLRFKEPAVGAERLLIFGGGHIAVQLCHFAAKVGFRVWIAEEREEFAGKERFPEAEKVICASYPRALAMMDIKPQDYVAIVTRGHSCDGECLYYILTHQMPRYLGMIGSRKRVGQQFAHFMEMGISKEKLDKVHNPIGLSIGAVTPEEIALAVAAELVLEKRTGEREGEVITELEPELIFEVASISQPAAVATILSTTGSSPRKAGAKMLVFADSSIRGTVGGGLCENNAIKEAKALIGTGKIRRMHQAMDADAAAREGMACGGSADILIEDLSEGRKP